MESIFSHYKTEFELHYPLNNYAQAKIYLLAFRNCFNEEGSQKHLDYKTPKDFLKAHLLSKTIILTVSEIRGQITPTSMNIQHALIQSENDTEHVSSMQP